MSRSNKQLQTNVESPVKFYFEWSGGEGYLKYYNKETGKNVVVPKMNFVVLDASLHSVSGFSDKYSSGIRGTEVRDLKKEEITVYINGQSPIKGMYDDLKNKVNGLKYAKPIYVGAIGKDGEINICKITLKGAALSSWLDFLKGDGDYAGKDKVNPYGDNIGITITGKSKPKKKGSTTYYCPNFEVIEITEEQGSEALELDKQVQLYLDSKMSDVVKPNNMGVGIDDIDDSYEDDDIQANSSDSEGFDELPF